MNSPVIQANDSLVLNGDFAQGTTSWTRGANPREVTVGSEIYEGTPIMLLSAGNLGSIWQELTIPVGAGANARYELKCLYETRHTEPALLLVTDAEGALLREIQLPPGSPRNPEEDKARIDSGQPLDFEPISYSAPFDLPLQRQDKIRVSVVAPYNADPTDYHLKVLITRIYLTLHLAPVALQTVKLDEELLSPGRTVHLCLGADGGFQHRLEFVPEPDSPWIHTKAALTSDDNPQGAVISTPEWGANQSLDLPWTLRCPMLGDQDPYLFKFNLVNQYTAEPYPMQVSLGHHRLVFRDVLEAAYYPVLALEQSVRLGVRVASWYTGQYLAGRTVTWTIEGQEILGTTPTDPEGWAYFDYLPASWGEFSIKASVASPYYTDGVATTTLDVSVLETDPWNELMAVVEGNALPWTQKTGYPNRGSTYSLMVRVPEVLRHTELVLRWQGDSADQLGVQVLPKLNESVPVDGLDLPWQLICQDVLDGRFELQFVCSKLLLPSGKKPMSLARNVVRIGEVQEANKFPVVDEHESVLLRVQVLHMVANGEGDPVNNAQVNWVTPEGEISTRSGTGGWASVFYQPREYGALEVIASVRAHPDAVAVERLFAVKALASSPWKNQVRILFDGVEVDLVELGLLCRRGASHTLRIEPAVGSSLLNQLLTLQWREDNPGIGLTVADIGVPQKLEAIGLEWVFSSQAASSISSLFSLTLSSPVLELPRELFGRLISAQLEDELTMMLDQVTGMQASQTFFPCIGARHAWRYLPNALSPLVGLQAKLMWLRTPPEELGAGVEPPLDEAQTLSDGGVGWTLDFTSSKATGEFQVGLYLPALAVSTSANLMRLGHNKLRIEDWRESATDAVIYKDEAWSWVRVVSAFTGQAASQITVQWKTAADSNSVATDDLGWSGFGLVPKTAGPHIVLANVVSPFDGYGEQRSLTFIALGDDPWDTVRVRFDGHDEQPWGSRTYFPRRNGTHVLELLIEEGSPLLLQELTLGLTGPGPAELGLHFEPALGVPHRPNPLGFRYAVRCDNLKDGGFALRLGAERLARLSPANAMSLGAGVQVLKILAGSSLQQVLEWGQELFEWVTVASSTTGKGIAGVLVTWSNDDLGTVTSLTDFYGVATLRFKPHTPGAAVVTVTVGDVLYSESVALSFTLQEPREIQALSSPDPIGYPGKEMSAEATVVSAMTGQPLSDVEVMWEYPGIKIASTKTDIDGKARVVFRLPPIRKGILQATVRGGYGGWEVRIMEFSAVPNSDTWLQEFTLWLNDREVDLVDGKLLLLSGTDYELELRTNKFSWLIPWADAALESDSTSEETELSFEPPLGHLRQVGNTPMRWSITTPVTAKSRNFSLKLISTFLPDFSLSGTLTNFAEALRDLDVHFETSPVILGSSAIYPCLGGLHTVSVRPKADSPLLGTSVKLKWSGEPAASLDVVVTPSLEESQQLIQEGVVWTLDCKQSRKTGTFTLQFESSEWAETSLPLTASLRHNLVTAERWSVVIPPGPGEPYPRTVRYIRATSSFLNVPAPGVRVEIKSSSSTWYENTQGNGELVYNQEDFESFKITNPYDGSIA